MPVDLLINAGVILTMEPDTQPFHERAEAISRGMADQLPDDWLK
jgi:hypothetical protein